MSTDFTIILPSRQHFGDNRGTFNVIEPDLRPAKRSDDISFDCPNVNSGETAYLMFQSRDVDHQQNFFKVNGVQVSGGLPASPSRDTWNGNIMLIASHHRLTAANNVLHVESRNESGGSSGNIDDFIIDNVVIVYKTRQVLPERTDQV